MWEYVTSGNIALLFMIVYSILKFVAPFTLTKTDDKVVDFVDKTRAWIQEEAPGIWAQIEVASRKGQISGKAAKLYAFLEAMNAAHVEDTGVPLPADALPKAKRAAAEVSAFDKLAKEVLPDPPVAPLSK